MALRRPVMGPAELFYADVFASRDTGCRSALGKPGLRDQHAGCVGNYLFEHDLCDFLLLSLPDNDTHSHRFGPDSQVASIAAADRQIERMAHAAGGVDAVPRHARAGRRRRPLARADRAPHRVRGRVSRLPRARPVGRRLRRGRDRAVPVGALGADLRARARGPRCAGAAPRDRGAGARGRRARAAPRRRARACCAAPAAASCASRRVAMSATRAAARWSVDGDLAVLNARVEDGLLVTPDHPDALGRCWAALYVPDLGRRLPSAAPGFEFPDWGGVDHVGGGSHGSLHHSDSLGALLFCGVEAPPRQAWGIQDVAPHVHVRLRATLAGSMSAAPMHRRVRHGLRRRHNWFQFVRFGVVGASGYVVNLAIYAAPARGSGCTTAARRPAPGSAACSTTSGGTATGPSARATATRASRRLRFFVVSFVAFLVSLGVLTLLVEARAPEAARAGDRDRRGHAAELRGEQAVVVRALKRGRAVSSPCCSPRRPRRRRRCRRRAGQAAAVPPADRRPGPEDRRRAAEDPAPSGASTRAHTRASSRRARRAGRSPTTRATSRPRRSRRSSIDDPTGAVLEQWTGYKVAWTMARGYPGAFGRKVNSPWVWIPLCLLFLAPFARWRRPLSVRNLDLLVLLGFSVSLAYFNDAQIGMSVPLVYPLLLYLLVRMLWTGIRGGGRSLGLHLNVPARPGWPSALIFLMGFRDRAERHELERDRRRLRGRDRRRPARQGRPPLRRVPEGQRARRHLRARSTTWPTSRSSRRCRGTASGTTCRPPTARRSSSTLLCCGLLFLLGRRVRGPDLGIALAYAWAAYPVHALRAGHELQRRARPGARPRRRARGAERAGARRRSPRWPG